MDKITENGFAFSVGALLVGLLVFLWIWVLGPVFGIGGLEDELRSVDREINKFLKDDVLKPSRELKTATEEYSDELGRVIEVAKGFYDTKKNRFEEWLSPFSEDSDQGEYKVAWQGVIDKLASDYLEAFPRVRTEEEEEDDEDPAGVSVDGSDITSPEDMKIAQKQLLIIQEVFRVVNELKLGGLQRIHFPTLETRRKRSDPAADIPVLYGSILAGIEIELPLKDLRPLIVKLANSEQVPFVEITSVNVSKTASTLLADLVLVKEYDRRSVAESEKEGFTQGAEPALSAKIVLTAMDWKGLPEEGDGEEDDNDRS